MKPIENVNTIEVVNLVKDYGHNRGVFDISFKINSGDCFGFLGPNGAGKSTTIRHLMGFSKPDSGKCLINDKDPLKYHDEIFYHSYLFYNHKILYYTMTFMSFYIYGTERP